VSSFVAARFKGAEAGEGWPCEGEAVLSLPAAEVAPFVGDGTVEDLGDRRCRLHSGSWSWSSLAASFGRFGADIEEAAPQELRAAFAVLSRRFAAASDG
jgi:hypothetical protein